MATLRIFNGIRKLNLNYYSKNIKLFNACYHEKNSVKVQNNESNGTEIKKRTVALPKITLISNDNNVQVVTLEEAKKISDRRNLKLVKIVDIDTKTQRPVFKLMTGHEYLAADLKRRETKKAEKKNENALKGEKLVLLNSRISEHDLESRLKRVTQWLTKRHEVRVVISGDINNMEPSELLFKQIETKLKMECRIVQKRIKASELKFQILPPKIINKENTIHNNSSNANNNGL